MENQGLGNRLEDSRSINQGSPGGAASNFDPMMDQEEVTIESTSNCMIMCLFDVISIDLCKLHEIGVECIIT